MSSRSISFLKHILKARETCPVKLLLSSIVGIVAKTNECSNLKATV